MEKKTVEYIYTATVQVNDDHIVRRVESLDDRRERIVRCRDCEHGMGDGGLCELFAFPLGDGHIIPADVEPDGFCAWGEGRNGN